MAATKLHGSTGAIAGAASAANVNMDFTRYTLSVSQNVDEAVAFGDSVGGTHDTVAATINTTDIVHLGIGARKWTLAVEGFAKDNDSTTSLGMGKLCSPAGAVPPGALTVTLRTGNTFIFNVPVVAGVSFTQDRNRGVVPASAVFHPGQNGSTGGVTSAWDETA